MHWAVAFKFLHIGSMFTAVGVSVGMEIMAHRVARTGDVRAIRVFFGQAQRLLAVIPPLFLTGLLFGLLAAWSGAFDVLATWLLLAYLLFGITLALHATVGASWFRRVTSMARTAPDGPASTELSAVLHERAAGLLQWYTVTAVVVLVFIMVVKPFS
jgi:Predicted integral membrane protein (DUF2269)